MPETVKASAKGLMVVDLARRRMGWTKTWTATWWGQAHSSQATLRRFWRGKRIQKEAFIAICQAVGIDNWQPIVDDSDRELAEAELFLLQEIDSGNLVHEDLLLSQSLTGPELPEGPVSLNSDFYVQRSNEDRCYAAILKPGALIRIKAPRKMGKTSLLARIIDRAQKHHYHIARLNLRQATPEMLRDLDQFLQWFSSCISHKLQLSGPENDWGPYRGSIVNCTSYLQEGVLAQLERPIVLALDDVDYLFQSPSIAQGFFSMLRIWHEEAKTVEDWEKLRLVVAHSTEDYGLLDIHQSPFNVGLPIELSEFTFEQMIDLAQKHQLTLTQPQIQQLADLLGGHPYLVRLAFYHLYQQDLGFSQLLNEAATDTGIYEDHLRCYLLTLRQQTQLASALAQILLTCEPVQIDTLYAYKLYSMGLIKRQGNLATIRCKLYRQYLLDRLQPVEVSQADAAQ